MNLKFKETEIGLIPEDWRIDKLENLTTKIATGSTPPSDIREYTEDGVNFIRSSNIFDFYIDKKNIIKINKECIPLLMNSEVEEGDVLLNITGDGITFSRDCIVTADLLPAYTNQSIAIIRTNEKLDGRYLSYYLSLKNIKKYMENFNAGSARRTLAAKHVKQFLVPFPSLDEQIRISNTIKSLNQKIDLNYQIIQNLENIGHAIFKHWFIDFEFPYNGKHYKSNGGEMVDTELGEIPKGWKIKKLSEICSKVIDGTHDTPKPAETGYHLVTGKNIINSFIDFSQCYLISPEDHEIVMKRSKPEKGDTIFSNIGTLGRITRVDQEFEYSIKNVALFKPLKPTYSSFIYQYFSLPEIILKLENQAPGTTQKFLSLKILREFELIKPSDKILSKYSDIIEPILNLRTILNNENLKISEIRDSLLPRLISGKIRLNKPFNLDYDPSKELEALE